MARPDVAKILDKDFVALKIDTDRMTGGKEMLDGTKGKGGGIPWFAFLDGDGATLVDSNGPKGNVGSPNTDAEIDHFLSMVKKVMVNITEDDVAALKKALIEHRDKK